MSSSKQSNVEPQTSRKRSNQAQCLYKSQNYKEQSTNKYNWDLEYNKNKWINVFFERLNIIEKPSPNLSRKQGQKLLKST